MAVKITDPKTTSGHSGGATGAASGAAQGAAVGTAILPGVGTAVGAVVGAIGGWITGSGNDKADYHRKMADLYRRQALDLQGAAQRRDMIRKFRALRASAILGATQEEGGSRSSAPQGSLASLNTQFAGADAYMQAGVYMQRQMDKHTRKGAKAAANAQQNAAIMDSAFKAATAIHASGVFSPSPSVSQTPGSISQPYSPSFGTPTYSGAMPTTGIPSSTFTMGPY